MATALTVCQMRRSYDDTAFEGLCGWSCVRSPRAADAVGGDTCQCTQALVYTLLPMDGQLIDSSTHAASVWLQVHPCQAVRGGVGTGCTELWRAMHVVPSARHMYYDNHDRHDVVQATSCRASRGRDATSRNVSATLVKSVVRAAGSAVHMPRATSRSAEATAGARSRDGACECGRMHHAQQQHTCTLLGDPPQHRRHRMRNR